MPHNCCVTYCRNNTKKGYRLFKIPVNSDRKHIWLDLIARPNLHDEARICECHFSNEQFESARMDGKKLLKPFAVPDLLCTSSTNKRKWDEDAVPKSLKLVKTEENQIAKSSSNDVSLNVSHEISKNYTSDSSHEDSLLNCSNDEELDELLKSLKDTEDVMENLKKTVKSLSRKCRLYEKKLKEWEHTNLEKIFNMDQLQVLKTDKHKGMVWSDDTISKAYKLFIACGSEGYTELIRQKLPYPNIRALQHHLRSLV